MSFQLSYFVTLLPMLAMSHIQIYAPILVMFIREGLHPYTCRVFTLRFTPLYLLWLWENF